MTEHRLVRRALGACAGVPFGHLARLGGVEAKAEAVAHVAILGLHARDQRLLPALEPHRMHVNVA